MLKHTLPLAIAQLRDLARRNPLQWAATGMTQQRKGFTHLIFAVQINGQFYRRRRFYNHDDKIVPKPDRPARKDFDTL